MDVADCHVSFVTWLADDPQESSRSVLAGEVVKAVSVHQSPVSVGAVSVVPHHAHLQGSLLTINTDQTGDLSKLFVVTLVSRLQSVEILPGPRLPGHGSGYSPGIHVTVEIKILQLGVVLGVYLNFVRCDDVALILHHHLSLKLNLPSLHGNHRLQVDSLSHPATLVISLGWEG